MREEMGYKWVHHSWQKVGGNILTPFDRHSITR